MENIYNIDETSKKDVYITNIGFAIGTNQTSYVVVDSRLYRKYQTQPAIKNGLQLLNIFL